VPGALGAVKVAVLPGSTVTSKLFPSSEVTVCVGVSLFDTVTVAPALTVVAENVKLAIEMVAPLEEDELEGDEVVLLPLLPLLLQAEAATARPATKTMAARRWGSELGMRRSTTWVTVRFTRS
jgi:hypothetical protein